MKVHCIWALEVSSFVISNWFGFMVFNTTFNNISVISWLSVLLVEEIGVPRENHQPAGSHWQNWSHNAVQSSPWVGIELTTSVVIGTDCIDSCNSNYHTITATTSAFHQWASSLIQIHVYTETLYNNIYPVGKTKYYDRNCWNIAAWTH